MSFFGSNSAPTPTPPAVPDPLPSAAPPSYASGGSRQRPGGNSNAVPGFGSTLMTSASGVDSSGTNLVRKSLLGQ